MFKSLFDKITLKFLIKKRLQHRHLPVSILQNFKEKFLLTDIKQKITNKNVSK